MRVLCHPQDWPRELRHHAAHPDTGRCSREGIGWCLGEDAMLGAVWRVGPPPGWATRAGSPCSPAQLRLKNQLQSSVEQRQLCLPVLTAVQLPASPQASREGPSSPVQLGGSMRTQRLLDIVAGWQRASSCELGRVGLLSTWRAGAAEDPPTQQQQRGGCPAHVEG